MTRDDIVRTIQGRAKTWRDAQSREMTRGREVLARQAAMRAEVLEQLLADIALHEQPADAELKDGAA